MISSWLQFSTRTENEHSFEIRDGSELTSPTGDTITSLGEMLYDALVNPALIEWLTDECGIDVAEEFVRAHAFPSVITTAVGDFGEVLAGRILEEFESLVVPIKKLRFRESAAGPMKLTDVMAIRIGEDEGAMSVEAICLCSVKTATTTPGHDVAVNGYKQLEKDDEQEKPEILSFALDKLWSEGKFGMAALFGDLLARRDRPTPRLYRLCLVIDRHVWDESLLQELEEEEPSLSEFAVYALQIGALRGLIDASYDRAKGMAG